MAPRTSTKEKILNVAEGLFAEYGFNDTSLRTITGRANVNLASVNYHFGDKKTLVRAVLDRYLEALMPSIKTSLIELNTRDSYTMEEVFESLRLPLSTLNEVRPNGTALFMLLLGRGYTDVQGHLRWFITTRYEEVLKLFTASIMKANPELTEELLFWRLHFTLGTCVFTMASSQALSELAESKFGQEADIKSVVDLLIPYLSAGMSAK
ncbi:TetR/AcrR family transcriptional regulator [Vibrio sp. EA2]|jgi:AcrR family transcriptional regulator|uniref:TetR/AcrR family transcriptional regulator n=1 Tax=Vibrio sp. EA2 TaxID=3079860 RepID=UPI00294A0D0D|nr:TetR/AcrR family transcriptional regulator [Vibrio sp. EA2]MDV6250805.1 TetR/AcrR family transcriptional regulator [Vibrio sp. EA2]